MRIHQPRRKHAADTDGDGVMARLTGTGRAARCETMGGFLSCDFVVPLIYSGSAVCLAKIWD